MAEREILVMVPTQPCMVPTIANRTVRCKPAENLDAGHWKCTAKNGYAVVLQPQHLPQLSHGQLYSGRHQTLLAVNRGGLEDLSC